MIKPVTSSGLVAGVMFRIPALNDGGPFQIDTLARADGDRPPVGGFPGRIGLDSNAPGRCFALMGIKPVSKDDAKEMGIEVRVTDAGPKDAWVELEFKPEGSLKDFSHVSLEIRDGDKLLVGYAPLQDKRTDAGNVVVRFMADWRENTHAQ